ncbi:MAG: exopolysaccharide biosynthesis protein [Alphaproteobacteria bacterium]|nr:exopolysaccharide biosynthesis protein [Alphaproteobacteria bacterium]
MTRKNAVKAAAHSFADLLTALSDLRGQGQGVTLRRLLEAVGRRSFGAVILLLGFVSISPLTIVPGANWLVASVTFLFSAQILIGRTHPWLPAKLLDTPFPGDAFDRVVSSQRVRRWATVMDRLARPRMIFLTEAPFVMLPACAVCLTALVTFPLSLVPLGPILPGVSLILLGAGMTARDGVWLMVSLASVGGSALLFARWLQWVT